MAQGGVIFQITYCLILKYKKIVTLQCFSSNISVLLERLGRENLNIFIE